MWRRGQVAVKRSRWGAWLLGGVRVVRDDHALRVRAGAVGGVGRDVVADTPVHAVRSLVLLGVERVGEDAGRRAHDLVLPHHQERAEPSINTNSLDGYVQRERGAVDSNDVVLHDRALAVADEDPVPFPGALDAQRYVDGV